MKMLTRIYEVKIFKGGKFCWEVSSRAKQRGEIEQDATWLVIILAIFLILV